MDIGETVQVDNWELGREIPDKCGVVEDTRLLRLSEHLVEVGLIDGHAVGTEHGSRQRGALFLAHGRQLCTVADE